MPVTYKEYKGWNAETKSTEEVVHSGVHAGRVLAEYSQTVRIMSDVWEPCKFALVWTDKGPVEISEPKDVVVDATPEVLELLRQWFYNRALSSLKSAATEKAVHPTPGKVVQVKRGRKDLGKVGKVVFMKEMPYSMGYREAYLPKLCVALDGTTTQVAGKYGKTFTRYSNTIWVWAKNVDVVKVDPVDETPLQATATEWADASMKRLKQSYFQEHYGPTYVQTSHLGY